MATLVSLAVFLALGLALAVLWKAYVQLMASFVWSGVLLAGFWVAGNVVLIVHLQRASEQSALWRWVHRGWSSFFFYSSLLQCVVFLTLIFWTLSILFRSEVTPPESMQEFVVDFVKGSSALAAFVFLAMGIYALVDGSGLVHQLAAILYLVAVAAAAVLPWLFPDHLSTWSELRPGRVFWSTVGIYALLSTVGMALYDIPFRLPAEKPP